MRTRASRRTKTHERLLAVVSLLAAVRRVLALYELLRATVSLHSRHLPFFALRARPPQEPRTTVDGKAGQQDNKEHLLDVCIRVTCQTLDVVALLADNAYLFARLRLLPINPRLARRLDRWSDGATLLTAALGLAQVARKRRELYHAGKIIGKQAIRAEARLEDLDFWEDDRAGTAGTPPSSAPERATDASARRRERIRLRNNVLDERRRLRVLREDLGDLWWERLRLGADGLFARESLLRAPGVRLQGSRRLQNTSEVYDALDLSLAPDTVKSWAGITSAAIESVLDPSPRPPRRPLTLQDAFEGSRRRGCSMSERKGESRCGEW